MTTRESRRSAAFILTGLFFAGFAVALVLYFFDPARVHIYPVCYFHRFTGLLCPGCGGLRAAHQLLHGNIAEAFRLNAFLVLATPALLWLAVRLVVRLLKGQPADFSIRPAWLWTVLALLLAFGIVRNLAAA